MEAELLAGATADVGALVHRNSQATRAMLTTAADGLREHLVRLARWSEGKTLTLFRQVYQRMAVLAREPIHQLYADIVRYLDAPAEPRAEPAAAQQPSPPGPGRPGSSAEADSAWWLSSPPQGDTMTDSVNLFFARLFPLTFHTTVAPPKKMVDPTRPQRQLEAAYEHCLSSKMNEVQPFGEAPRALAHSLSRALEAARVLLGALRIGADVLNATGPILVKEAAGSGPGQCAPLLLRLHGCPRCAGLAEAVRPCQRYCLNALHACLTERASEMDSPWAAFVDATAKLAGSAAAAPAFPGRPRSAARSAPYQLNAEEAIRQMENTISEAIMFAMENGPAVERKMKSACGPPKWVDADSSPSTTTPSTSTQLLESRRSLDGALGALGALGPLAAEEAGSPASTASAVHFAKTLRELQESLQRSRSFYANLVEVLCADQEFAARDAQPCWNGQRVAEYTKSLTPASASAQRYNPELARPGSALIASFESAFQEQARLAQLGDQLRHVRQLVMSQLTELAVATSPESDSFVRGDEETEALEGSGASGVPGATPWSDDEDHHNGWAEGEGSGRGSGDEPLPVDPSPTWTPKQPAPTETEEVSEDKKTSGVDRVQHSAMLVLCFVAVLRLAAP